jgi:hypothetical protein
MKIYVVTKGYYSDYHIITATLSKQRAENIAKIYTDRYDTAEVEEFDEMSDETIDRMMEELELRYVFNIQQDGTVSAVEVVYEKKNAKIMDTSRYDRIHFSIPAKDKEHAIKIAIDLRYKYYAEKYGL